MRGSGKNWDSEGSVQGKHDNRELTEHGILKYAELFGVKQQLYR